MGLFHLITYDVLPEVCQYLITQVFLLESIMRIWNREAGDVYLCFHQSEFLHFCTFQWLHEKKHINLQKFALNLDHSLTAFLCTNNKSHVDFWLIRANYGQRRLNFHLWLHWS